MNATDLLGQTDGVLHLRDAGGSPQAAHPRITINAAGPWIDWVNATLGHETRFIGGTKGSHILLDHPDLIAQLDGRMIYFDADATHPSPILSLVGGKWTTFRGFAEEVTDDILSRLSRLSRPRRVSTRARPIGGGRDLPTDAQAWATETAGATGLTPARCAVLLSRYGSTASEIAAHEGRVGGIPLTGDPDTTLAEIDWIARNEQVTTLEDVILRRTTLAVTGCLAERDVTVISKAVGTALNWDTARETQEARSCLATLRARNLMRI